MEFSERKFRSLSKEAQAKKLADTLSRLLQAPGDTWKETLRNYNDASRWAGHSDQCLAPSTLKVSLLKESYFFWRELTGLGPEKALLSLPEEKDRPEALEPSIPWDVWLPSLRSAHNVGSIFRTADCLGIQNILISGYTPSPEHKGVAASAMGSQNWMPWKRWETAEDFLKENNKPLIAIELSEKACSLEEFEWPDEGVIVLGNEEAGISMEILDECAHHIQIPMFGRKGSMNVSNAFAITLWELRRKLTLNKQPKQEK